MVLAGYGLRIAVERGHLAVADGLGGDRRAGLLAKATCGLKRLVVLGHAGTVSLEALRWLADVGAAFVQIGADGEIIACTAPAGNDDPRLRRAQALATTNGVGLEIARNLIRQKLVNQAALFDRLHATDVQRLDLAAQCDQLEIATSIESLRVAEARGAAVYWSAWNAVPVRFARRDVDRVPAHWWTFGIRASTLANGPRRAINPANALLNYCYAMLETEARIACLKVGLDPGMGVMHADLRARDSLALDVMEPIRPRVDALVFDLLAKRNFAARDFFETRDGQCRLMPSITHDLAVFAPQFATWVAPVVEEVVRHLINAPNSTKTTERSVTPLTQANRRTGRDGIRVKPRAQESTSVASLKAGCRECGAVLEDPERVWCDDCSPNARIEKDRANLEAARKAKAELRAKGEDPSHGGEVALKRAATHREHMRLNAEWEASNTRCMTEEEYRTHILPGLSAVTIKAIASVMGVSTGYAIQVRRGDTIPHPRHWDGLNRLQRE